MNECKLKALLKVYDLFSYLIILTSSAMLMQRGTNMPLHQSYQRQVLNMQCFTPQFASGKIILIIIIINLIFFLSRTQTNKSGDFCLLNQEHG